MLGKIIDYGFYPTMAVAGIYGRFWGAGAEPDCSAIMRMACWFCVCLGVLGTIATEAQRRQHRR